MAHFPLGTAFVSDPLGEPFSSFAQLVHQLKEADSLKVYIASASIYN